MKINKKILAIFSLSITLVGCDINTLFEKDTSENNNSVATSLNNNISDSDSSILSSNNITSNNVIDIIDNTFNKHLKVVAIDNVVLLQTSFYKDVPVVDSNHSVIEDGIRSPGDCASEIEDEGNWLDELIKAIINFFKSIPAFFIKYKWLLYVVIGAIVFLIFSPILTTLVNQRR